MVFEPLPKIFSPTKNSRYVTIKLMKQWPKEVVEVIRSPDAPHLVGNRGEITHKEGKWTCVKIGDAFTHFRKGDIRVIRTT